MTKNMFIEVVNKLFAEREKANDTNTDSDCVLPVVVFSGAELSCATCKHEELMPLYICCDCVNHAKHELAT